jgi:type I restriction enzyme S subunit
MIRFADLKCPFDLVEIGDCVEVLDHQRKPINADARRERTGNIPYYGANGQVGWIDRWIFDEDLVLVAEDGGFFEDPFRAISYRISGKAWVNNHAHVLRPTKSVDVDWLNYAIGHQDVTRLVKGATLKKLNQKDLKKITIPLPNIEDQRRIVARLKECMERVEEIEALRSASLKDQQHLSASLIESELHAVIANDNKWQNRSLGEIVVTVRNGRSIAQETN